MVYDRHSSDRLSSNKSRIMSMLLYDERDTNDLRRMLLSVTEQLKQESQRADENERRAREAIQRFKAINEARLAAQQDAARANEELNLYKIQLEYAQQEIFKAQDILDSLETQRHDAEASAAKARNVARKLKEETLVDLAREEGRRIGLQEGITRGRRLGMENARSPLDRRESRVIPSAPSLDNITVVQEEDVRSTMTGTPPGPSPLDPIGETMLNFPPSPSHTAPNPEIDTKPGPVPVVVRNTPSPSHHPENIIPPDGFIPLADNATTIRLPPPHEMVPPVAPSPPISLAGTEPLMVPNPGVRPDFVPFEPESPGSTTISQFELVSEPSGSIPRPSRKNRPSLSVIAESVSSNNTPADRARSISLDPTSPRPPSSASVPHGQSPVLAPVSPQPTFRMSVTDASLDPNQNHYVYRRPSFASSSSSSAGVADRTPVGSTRGLSRMTSSSSVPDITVQPPSRPQSQTPQATPFVSHREFLSAEDAANRPISPTVSTTVLANPSSPKTPSVLHDSSNSAGGSTPKFVALPDGQLPPGFVPHFVSSPSQSMQSRATPISAHAAPPGPPSGVVASPKLPTQTALYGVPVPDGSSSSGRHSLYHPVRIPVTSTTADSSVMVPPPSIFSQPPEPSSSETTEEDDAVASSIASSNDTLTTPPPSRKKAKAKAKAKRPTYDAAPTPPGQEYPTTPLMRGGALAPSGPSAAPTGNGRGASAGMTPAARPRSLRH
ncbi:hypothetical protein BJY52DRAFT_1235665 [Lactarius psammicola]|nr:hypothetical protein BJY52DRAFT_1235665 [Lactarius psammicola]